MRPCCYCNLMSKWYILMTILGNNNDTFNSIIDTLLMTNTPKIKNILLFQHHFLHNDTKLSLIVLLRTNIINVLLITATNVLFCHK